MSKLQAPRLLAVIVVGLRKFHVRASAAGIGRELGVVPEIELLELKPRLPGESIAGFNDRSVTRDEMGRAHLVVINGRVVKSSVSQADPPPAPEGSGDFDWSKDAGDMAGKRARIEALEKDTHPHQVQNRELGEAIAATYHTRVNVRLLEVEGDDLDPEQLGEVLATIAAGLKR